MSATLQPLSQVKQELTVRKEIVSYPIPKPQAWALTQSLRINFNHEDSSSGSFGIREGRCGNQVHSVGTLISGDETLANASVHCAVRGAGLVRKAREVGLNEIL